MARFREKWTRESAKWNNVLEGVPAAIEKLGKVELHESLRKEGQKTLMDVIPVQLVRQSADKLKAQMEKDEQSLYTFFIKCKFQKLDLPPFFYNQQSCEKHTSFKQFLYLEQSRAIWSERSEQTARKGEERLRAMDELENVFS